MIVSVIHILAGLVLLAILHRSFYKRQFVEQTYVRNLLRILALLIAIYHVKKYIKTKQWIYLFHAVIVAGSILYMSFDPKIGRQVLQLIAVSMIGYHLSIILGVV